MVIEVLAAEVGEHGHVEADPPDPLQVERVGGNLHQAVGHARVEHVLQHPLEVGRFGRRPPGRELEVRSAVADRPDDPGREARLLENGFEDVGRRRLAFGPGDADELHPVGRVAVEIGRAEGQGLARIEDPDPGGRDPLRLRTVREDGRRPAPRPLRRT